MSMRATRLLRTLVLLVSVVVTGALGLAVASADSISGSQLDGRLIVVHGDDFKTHAVTMQVSLHTSTGDVSLRTPSVSHDQLLALAGRRVRARGTRVGKAFNATGLSALDARPASIVRSGPFRIAYILLRPAGATYKPISTSAARAEMFTGAKSVAAWYAQTSYGQLAITGKVFGSYDTNLTMDTCSFGAWLGAGVAAAAADGYTSADYDDVVVATPALGCSFGGLGTIGGWGALVGGNLNYIIEHELGHNLGLAHANSYTCNGVPFSTTACLWTDYGDAYDVMGRSDYEFNAEHKREIGWIPSTAVATAAPGTHTYNLTAMEVAPTPGSTQLIEIPRPDGTKYAIERREPIGIDASPIIGGDNVPYPSVRGVWVRQAQGGTGGGAATALVDMSVQGGGSDGRLGDGQTFADAASQVKITTVSTAGLTSQVTVCVGPCGGYPTPPPPDRQVTVDTHEGAVFVGGTTHDDVIHVSAPGGTTRLVDANGAFVRALGPGCVANSDNTVVTCQAKLWFDVFGGDGNDTLSVSGKQRAQLYGQNGDDLLIGGPKNDLLSGGDGFDTADLRAVKSGRDVIDPDVERVLRS